MLTVHRLLIQTLKHSASEHLRWPSLRPGKNSFEGLCIATDMRKGGNNHFCEQLQADLKASLAVNERPFARVTSCFHGPVRASSPRAHFRGQNPSFHTSGFSVLSVLVYMTIFTSFQMTHIEAKSIHIWLRYDKKWEILILSCTLACGCSNMLCICALFKETCLLSRRILKKTTDQIHGHIKHVLNLYKRYMCTSKRGKTSNA